MPFLEDRHAKARCKAARRQRPVIFARCDRSALARLEAALHLVDHIDPALAADQAIGAVAAAQRFQRVTDLHGTCPDALKGPSEGRSSQEMGLFPPTAKRPGTARFLSSGDPNVNANRAFRPD